MSHCFSLALKLGLTYLNLLKAITTADSARLLHTCKAMLLMIMGHNTRGNHADEILRFLVQQTAVLSELEAHRVLAGMLVNVAGKSNKYYLLKCDANSL